MNLSKKLLILIGVLCTLCLAGLHCGGDTETTEEEIIAAETSNASNDYSGYNIQAVEKKLAKSFGDTLPEDKKQAFFTYWFAPTFINLYCFKGANTLYQNKVKKYGENEAEQIFGYMKFDESIPRYQGPSLQINEFVLGPFASDHWELIYTSAQIIYEVLGLDSGLGLSWQQALESISGLPLKNPNQGEYATINYYNPEMALWAVQNLIPEPSDSIYNIAYQNIYDSLFKRYFRMLAKSYMLIHADNQYDNHVNSFIANVVEGNQYVYSFIHRNYSMDALNDSEVYSANSYYHPITLGFWLRRCVGKTDGVVWVALRKFMETFDGDWLNQTCAQMKVSYLTE